jgi:hypothetical protein
MSTHDVRPERASYQSVLTALAEEARAMRSAGPEQELTGRDPAQRRQRRREGARAGQSASRWLGAPGTECVGAVLFALRSPKIKILERPYGRISPVAASRYVQRPPQYMT